MGTKTPVRVRSRWEARFIDRWVIEIVRVNGANVRARYEDTLGMVTLTREALFACFDPVRL